MLRGKFSNKSLYNIAIATCVLGIVLLTLYLVNINSFENRSEIGKIELFVKTINSPQGMAFDQSGRLFAQSEWDGKISIISNDGKATDYSYIEDYYGYGMDIDYSDNFILASKQQITVYNNSGKVIRVIKGFTHAYDVAVGSDNTLFVSDSATNSIYQITPKNEVILLTVLGDKKSNSTHNAAGICFDDDFKNLYAVNMYSGELFQISISQAYKVEEIKIIASNLKRPNFIDVDEDNNVFITCLGDNTIVRVNQNSIKEPIDTKGKISNPSGIVINNNEKVLYIGSKDNNSIYKINIVTNSKTKK
jgi:sugar lactone lactonase YvrE